MANTEADLQKHQSMEEERKWHETRLAALMFQGFHGRVTLYLEGGRLKKVTEERTYIPPSSK